MAKSLCTDQVERYERDGYLCPLPVLSPSEAAQLEASVREHIGRFRGHLGEPYKHKVHLIAEWADQLVHHPAILDMVTSVLGPDVLCWTSNLLVKPAHHPAFVSWHQDSGYWALKPAEVLSAWIAITPSNRNSGCVQVSPGTHREGPLEHTDTFDPDNLLTRGQTIAAPPDPSKIVDLVLQPGEMSLHHVGLAHASAPNTTDVPRIGLAIRYMSTRVGKQGAQESAMLVRGSDRHQHFIAERRLSGDFALTDRMAHNRALRLQVQNNYRQTAGASAEQRFKLGLKKRISEGVLDASYLALKLRADLTGARRSS